MRASFRGLPAVLLIGLTGCGLPRWPVDGPLSSPFGLRLDGWRPELHHGVDIVVPVGTTVRAMDDGRVAFAGTRGGYGQVVMLEHGSTLTLYAHLSELRVRAGQQVRNGDPIGLSGMSGNASGPHLHFEIVRHGRIEDPVLLLGGPPRRR